MDNETDIGLVVAHPKGRRCHHALDLVAEEPLEHGGFGIGLDHIAAPHVGAAFDAMRSKKRCDHLDIATDQAVDDACAGKIGDISGQPSQALIRLTLIGVDLQAQTVSTERPTDREQVLPKLRLHISHHTIVGGGGAANYRHTLGQVIQKPSDSAVVGTEIVAPVADAVDLIDHHEPDA